MNKPVRYQWTATGLRPSDLEFGPTRYVSEHDYDALRRELDDAYAEIMKLSPEGLRRSVVFDRAVHDRARKERERILARSVDTPE